MKIRKTRKVPHCHVTVIYESPTYLRISEIIDSQGIVPKCLFSNCDLKNNFYMKIIGVGP